MFDGAGRVLTEDGPGGFLCPSVSLSSVHLILVILKILPPVLKKLYLDLFSASLLWCFNPFAFYVDYSIEVVDSVHFLCMFPRWRHLGNC